MESALRSGVGLHLWTHFGLTFRVSLRFISLFSSISSCSLRAAKNQGDQCGYCRRMQTGDLFTKCLEITEKGNKHPICIMWLIKSWLNRISFSKLKSSFHHWLFNTIRNGYQGRNHCFVHLKLFQGFLVHVCVEQVDSFNYKDIFFCVLQNIHPCVALYILCQSQRKKNPPDQRSMVKGKPQVNKNHRGTRFLFAEASAVKLHLCLCWTHAVPILLLTALNSAVSLESKKPRLF